MSAQPQPYSPAYENREPRPREVIWWAAALATGSAIAIGIHARHYLPFLSDDALISLRYARRLLDGHGLSWTDGQPVEGYSNLLWVLLVAAAGALRVDLIAAARVLGLACTITIPAAVSYTVLREHAVRAAIVPLCAAAVFVAAGAPIAVWAIGGLEQPLLAGLFALSIAAMNGWLRAPSRRAAVWLSLTLGLMCLTRPDAPLFVAAAVLAILCARGLSLAALRSLAGILAGPVLLAGAQMIFRLAYYHSSVPNTALVKLAPSLVHAQGGWRYLAGGVTLMWPFSWLALACAAGLLLTRGSRARAWYPLIAGLAWSGYVVLIGGDIFPAYRHLVVLFVAVAYVLAEGGAVLVGRSGAAVLAQAVAALLTIASAPVYARAQLADRQTQRAVKERWEWQGRDLALVLKSAFGRQRALMAVTAAGCLPYWSGLPSLDMLGLNDYYLPRHPPANMGEGPLGHELGDAQYVLDRNPDLIVFNVGTEPAYRAGDLLNKMPEFHRRYVPARVEAGGEAYLVYVNRYSPRIGIAASSSGVTIPAFVFEGAPVHLDAAGRLVAPLAASTPLRATMQVDGGPWDAEIESRDAGRAAADVSTANGTVTITLRTSGADAIEVQSVTLRPRPL